MSIIFHENESYMKGMEFCIKLMCDELLKIDCLKKEIIKSDLKTKDCLDLIDTLYDACTKNALFYGKLLNDDLINRKKS